MTLKSASPVTVVCAEMLSPSQGRPGSGSYTVLEGCTGALGLLGYTFTFTVVTSYTYAVGPRAHIGCT